jgi:hypothetical protein
MVNAKRTLRSLHTNRPLSPLILDVKVPERRDVGPRLFQDHQEMEVLVLHVIPCDVELNRQGAVGRVSFDVVVDPVRLALGDLQVFPEGK